jgi:hypothetical protein
MLSAIDLSWTPEDDEAAVRANQAWLDEFHAAMQPFASDESFQNFIDEAETNYLRAYYGTNSNVWSRSSAIRSRQSVPLSAERPAVAVTQDVTVLAPGSGSAFFPADHASLAAGRVVLGSVAGA